MSGGSSKPLCSGLSVGGLFAGVGGLELGFQRAGFVTSFSCEIDEDARAVLAHRFPNSKILGDVAQLKSLPAVDVLAAGFPCQDLSAVGPRQGLDGTKSSSVKHVFDLIETARKKPDWIVLENVPFMLNLNSGQAIASITKRLEELRYGWAYRIVDTLAFGLPLTHRRGRGNQRLNTVS